MKKTTPPTPAAKNEWSMRDAHAALLAAVQMNNWAGVAKYAAQLEAFQVARTKIDGALVTITPNGTVLTS